MTARGWQVVLVAVGVASLAQAEPTFRTEAQFTDGDVVFPRLVFARDGRLFGEGRSVAPDGGLPPGLGGVFALARDGSGRYRQLTAYPLGHPGTLGPMRGGLVQAQDGALYGVQESCGWPLEGTSCEAKGVVFRFRPDHPTESYEVVHVFHGLSWPDDGGGLEGDPDDGAQPRGPLLEGPDGTLYGVTSAGGTTGQGTVYQLAAVPDGGERAFSLLHAFLGYPSDGAAPRSGSLAELPDGGLAGMTLAGGTVDRGVVFTLTRDDAGALTRYQAPFSFERSGFRGFPERDQPESPMVFGQDGRLHGVESRMVFAQVRPGIWYPWDLGVAWQLSPVTGGGPPRYTSLHAGTWEASVTEEASGGWLLVSYRGGASGHGAIAELTTEPSTGLATRYVVQHAFDSAPPPATGLTLGPDGRYYGVRGFVEPSDETSVSGPFSVFSIVSAPVGTSIEYFGPSVLVQGERPRLGARVLDQDGGPAAGVTVEVVLSGATQRPETCTATTDDTGVGRCHVGAWEALDASVQVSFAGDVERGLRDAAAPALTLSVTARPPDPAGCGGCQEAGGLLVLVPAWLVIRRRGRSRPAAGPADR